MSMQPNVAATVSERSLLSSSIAISPATRRADEPLQSSASARASSGPARKRLGELLTEAGHISDVQLLQALKAQQTSRARLGELLVQLGAIPKQLLLDTLAQQLKVQVAPAERLMQLKPSAQALAMVVPEVARARGILPFYYHQAERSLSVVMIEPHDLSTLREIKRSNALLQIKVLLGDGETVRSLIHEHYRYLASSDVGKVSSPRQSEQRPLDQRVIEVMLDLNIALLISLESCVSGSSSFGLGLHEQIHLGRRMVKELGGSFVGEARWTLRFSLDYVKRTVASAMVLPDDRPIHMDDVISSLQLCNEHISFAVDSIQDHQLEQVRQLHHRVVERLPSFMQSATTADSAREALSRYLHAYATVEGMDEEVLAATERALDGESAWLEQLKVQFARPTVWVLDSQPRTVRTTAQRLDAEGFQVEAMDQIEHVKHRLIRQTPFAIVCDLHLEPGVVNFCREVTSSKSPERPIFFVTGEALSVEEIVAVLGAGAEDIVSLRTESDGLIAKLKHQLRIYERKKTSRPEMSGHLSDLGLVDLLQMLQLGAKTARVNVESEGTSGCVYIDRGAVVHAMMGTRGGVSAFYDVCALASGIFSVDFSAQSPERSIVETTEYLLMEGLRRADEQRRA